MATTGKGARTRQRIVMCAATILAERGVAAMNLADVVQAASVTKGALYFHFASKEALLVGVEAEYHADSRSMVERIDLDPDPTRRLLLLTFELARRQADSVLALAHARLMLAPVVPPLRPQLPLPPVEWTEVLRTWLDDADERGLLIDGLDLDEYSEMLDDCLIGTLTSHQVEARQQDVFARVHRLWRYLLLPTLIADPARRSALLALADELMQEAAEPKATSTPQDGQGTALSPVS